MAKELKLPDVVGDVGKWALVVNNRTVKCSDSLEEIYRVASRYRSEDVAITQILASGASFY